MKVGEVEMTDRNTISQVIESLFEDWIDKNINVHPLAVENMRILETDALAIMKEREAMSWINVKDGLPNENGSYLVVYNAFQYALVDVKRFAKDLHSVDKYDFPNEHRPGWYEYDDEYGYIERNDITHWMPLPNLPEKGR